MDNKNSVSEEESNQNITEIVESWNESQEKLLKAIAERSNCMRWLHTESYLYYEYLNFYFTIPNVIISTLNGGFTMSLPSLFPDGYSQRIATTIIGLISIFSAMLITMNQYVKSQQMMEAHRSAGLNYGKLHRIIMNELSLRRDQRTNAKYFLKSIRIEIDRLENTSPSIIPSIIKKFNIQFAGHNIEKPEITGDLNEIEINKEIHKHKKDKFSFKKNYDLDREADKILFNMKNTSKILPVIEENKSYNIDEDKDDKENYIVYMNKKN